jgi:hypothetical protein
MHLNNLIKNWNKDYRITQYDDTYRVHFQKDWTKEPVAGEWRMKISEEDAQRVIIEKELVQIKSRAFKKASEWMIISEAQKTLKILEENNLI